MRTAQTTIRNLTAPLRRTPLVPDEVLKKHNVYFEIDTRFRAAARLLQAFWLKDNGIPTGLHISTLDDVVTSMPLGSILSPEAARAGRNFLIPEIHSLVRHELVMREEGAVIEEARLFGNALSSMPMMFNLFGPLALDLRLATTVFRQLLPDFVHSVEDFGFEHSPGRREERFLNDGTAFDLAIDVITPDGEPAKIYVEVKYSEDMAGPAARWRERYDEAARQARLFRDPDSQMLRSLALEQLFREHALAQLAVDNGVISRALFLVVAPRLNRRVQSAFRVYETELIDAEDQDDSRVGFKAVTIEQIIDAMREAGAKDIATALWHRYADFERIFDASISVFDPAGSSESASEATAVPPSTTTGSSDRARRQILARPTQKRAYRRKAGIGQQPIVDTSSEQAS